MPDMNQRMWVCEACEFAVIGDEHAAHQHHHGDGNAWDHWIYEFGPNEHGSLVVMTGRHIHTSDWGGFYMDDRPIYYESIERKFLEGVAHHRHLKLRRPALATDQGEPM